MKSLSGLCKLLAIWSLSGVLEPATALPYDRDGDDNHLFSINDTQPFADFGHGLIRRADKSPELRILSLGASIVFGVGSSNGNG